MPASTSRTPWRTFSGVSRLMRPSSSSSPQSPHVEPAGRCVHRFVTADSMPSIGVACVPIGPAHGRPRPAGRSHAHDAEGLRRLRPTGTSSSRPTCSAPASRSTCAIARSGRRTSRSSRSSRAAPAIFRRLHTPGFEGWTVSRYRQTRRADARRRPRDDPRGHGPRRRRRPGDAPEPVAVRALLRRPRTVDGARARLQRLRHRAVHAVLLATRAHGARAHHRHRRRRRRDRARRRGRVPRDPPAGDPAEAVLLARLRPGVGGGAGQRRARVHPHADRWREGRTTRRRRRSRSSWSRPRRSTSR